MNNNKYNKIIMGIIYCLTFPNNKKYIGQTRRNLEIRLKEHNTKPYCSALVNAINKYKTYEYEILLEINNELLDLYEIKFIKTFDTLVPNGYNIRDGGSNGKFCEETRLKMSESHKNKKHTEETIEKIRHSNLGKIISDEVKIKISETKKAQQLSDETKRKISRLGMKHTDEAKKLVSEANKGKIISSNQKEKVSSSLRKRGEDLPMYLLKKEKGYLVRVPGYKSKTFSQLTEDENLQLAKTHLNYIMNSVQRLNDNGEEIP